MLAVSRGASVRKKRRGIMSRIWNRREREGAMSGEMEDMRVKGFGMGGMILQDQMSRLEIG